MLKAHYFVNADPTKQVPLSMQGKLSPKSVQNVIHFSLAVDRRFTKNAGMVAWPGAEHPFFSSRMHGRAHHGAQSPPPGWQPGAEA
jgi:hypothetical protein